MTSLQKLAISFKHWPIHPQWLLGKKKLPEGLQNVDGLVLDIGAADRWIERSLPEGTEYIALDYPATGHGLYDAKPSIFADATLLPFADKQFDAVVCLEVIEHVPEPFQVFFEISRVLTLGGEAWISVPFLYPMHDIPYDFQRFTEFGLKRAAQKAGLVVISLQSTEHSIRTAGLLFSLAIAGGVTTKKGLSKYFLIPLALAGITIINLTACALSHIWPDWKPMSHGYTMRVCKV